MPTVDSSIALDLLRLAEDKNLDNVGTQIDKRSLQKRCIVAASPFWKDMLHQSHGDLPSNIRIELLSAGLRQARNELIEEKLKCQTSIRKSRKDLEVRDNSLMAAMTNLCHSRNDLDEKNQILFFIRSKLLSIEEMLNENNSKSMTALSTVLQDTKCLIDAHFAREKTPNL